MAFPPSTQTVPSLVRGQVAFGTTPYVIGVDANGINLKEIDGLDIEHMRSGDAGRPRDHGEFIGLDLLGGRDITVKFDVQPASLYMAGLATATVPTLNIEQPLYIYQRGYGLLATMARARQRSWKDDLVLDLGDMARNVSILWHATDPRFYTAPTQLASASAGPAYGFGFPLSFPLSFGGAITPESVTLINVGNIDCRPIITLTGPATDPFVANYATPSGPTVAFDLTLATGAQLVIDMDLQTALLYEPGVTVGSPYLADLAPGSQWWSILPGLNVIQVGAAAGAPAMTVEWASAWLL